MPQEHHNVAVFGQMCSAAALTFMGPRQRCRMAGSGLTFHASCVK